MFTLAEDRPTLGLLIGLPLGIAVAVACVVMAALCFRAYRPGYDKEPLVGGWILAALAVVALGVTGAALWPWKHDYHYWTEVNGTVEKVSNRLVSGGEGIVNQRFVVTINGQPYGVDDTRAALIKPGDRVSLRCKREYVWGSDSHGFACNWNGGEPTGGEG